MDRADEEALGATLAASDERPAVEGASSGPRLLEDPDAPLDLVASGTRYEVKATLGEGGMGEVRLCRDARIGREVAVKTIRRVQRGKSDVRARFFREARVQGQLEHPAIVPVHDIGRSEDGEPFFVMRRVRGETLGDVIDLLSQGDERAEKQYSRHALLTLFVRICLAVDYAHARGVVHRDLKPSNVMLGRFGEAYVLDWGVAKVKGAQETLDPRASRPSSKFRADGVADEGSIDVPSGATETGALLGTAGYMAPEQVTGSLDVDARADVYALGCILFELLVLAPMHGSGNTSGILQRTLRPDLADVERRLVAADAAPELRSICLRATARLAKDRHRTARALSEEVEAFLAGDRDVELRRDAVARHLEVARVASETALAGSDGEERAVALAELGRALALDPDNETARGLLVALLTTPPAKAPPEVLAELSAKHLRQLKRTLPFSAAIYVATALLVCFLAILGVKDRLLMTLTVVAWLATAGIALATRNVPRLTHGRIPWTSVASVTATGFMSLLFGPLVMAPMIVATNATGLVLAGAAKDRRVVLSMATLSMLGPLIASALGYFPITISAVDDALVATGGAVRFSGAPTFVVLGAVQWLILFGSIAFTSRYRDAMAGAELREQMLAWQLGKLVSAGPLPRPRARS